MSTRRLLKAAEAIREVVATSILTDLRDPRIRDVTVIGVEVSPDMREAKVSVSVMGTDAQAELSLRGLQNAAGFLQSKIAARIETRYTPKLRFVIDAGAKNVVAVGQILDRIRRESIEPTGDEVDSDMATDTTARCDSSASADDPDDDGTPLSAPHPT